MTFTYTYRDKTGGKREDVIEATSRQAAFADLKARGISPLSMREGGVRGGRAGARPSRSGVWYVCAAVVVMAAGIGWWLWRHSGSGDGVPQPVSVPSPVTAPQGKAPKKPETSEATKRQPAPVERVERTAPATVEQHAAVPAVVAADQPAEAVEAPATNDVKAPPPKPLFKTGAEQLLALATPSVPGAMVPPLPYVTEESIGEDLEKAMGNVIAPSADDTEETLERKITVSAQKEEFRELRKQGMTFTEYLKAMREKNNADAQFISDADKLHEEIFRDSKISDEEYKKERDKINEALRSRGLPEIPEDEE